MRAAAAHTRHYWQGKLPQLLTLLLQGSAMSRFPFEDRSALADLPPAVQQRLRPHAQAPWQADLGLAGRALGLGPQLPPRRHLRDTAAEGRQAVQQSSGSSLGGAEGEATCCQPYCTQVNWPHGSARGPGGGMRGFVG